MPASHACICVGSPKILAGTCSQIKPGTHHRRRLSKITFACIHPVLAVQEFTARCEYTLYLLKHKSRRHRLNIRDLRRLKSLSEISHKTRFVWRRACGNLSGHLRTPHNWYWLLVTGIYIIKPPYENWPTNHRGNILKDPAMHHNHTFVCMVI